MSFEKAEQYLRERGFRDRILTFQESSATVEEAAVDVGCEPKQIAKTMAFLIDDEPVLIVLAGDARCDNHKFKETFHQKARMIPPAEVEEKVGHAPGGVCPFGIREGIKVYLDESLRRFDLVYPACGNDHSAVKLTLPELETLSASVGWVDIAKGWQEASA